VLLAYKTDGRVTWIPEKKQHFYVEYIYCFVGWGSAGKVDDVIPSRAVQDGGYALPWQRYDNNKMAAIHNFKKNNNNTLSIHIQQQKYSLSVL